jgi:hypothetical protein
MSATQPQDLLSALSTGRQALAYKISKVCPPDTLSQALDALMINPPSSSSLWLVQSIARRNLSALIIGAYGRSLTQVHSPWSVPLLDVALKNKFTSWQDALYRAACQGNACAAQWIIQRTFSKCEVDLSEYLDIAAQVGSQSCASVFLPYSKATLEKSFCLFQAARYKRSEMVRFLSSRCSPDQALLLALTTQDADIADRLLPYTSFFQNNTPSSDPIEVDLRELLKDHPNFKILVSRQDLFNQLPLKTLSTKKKL